MRQIVCGDASQLTQKPRQLSRGGREGERYSLLYSFRRAARAVVSVVGIAADVCSNCVRCVMYSMDADVIVRSCCQLSRYR